MARRAGRRTHAARGVGSARAAQQWSTWGMTAQQWSNRVAQQWSGAMAPKAGVATAVVMEQMRDAPATAPAARRDAPPQQWRTMQMDGWRRG
jgi:hypothetical protein